jgi:transposase
LTLLNALVCRGENGCKWRALPEKFGHWHVIYMRLNRWARSGVLERVFSALQAEGLIRTEVLSPDSTSIKVHPDAYGASKKAGNRRQGRAGEDGTRKLTHWRRVTGTLRGSVCRPGTRLTRREDGSYWKHLGRLKKASHYLWTGRMRMTGPGSLRGITV